MSDGTAQRVVEGLLPTVGQMATLSLSHTRLLGQVIAHDGSGQVTVAVPDPSPSVRASLGSLEPFLLEYVLVGLCRGQLRPTRVEDATSRRSPLLHVHGYLYEVAELQRRDNFRVRLSLPVELQMVRPAFGAARATISEAAWPGRSVDVSAEGCCIAMGVELQRGDLLSLRLQTDALVIEADGRVIGPRPVPFGMNERRFGLQLVQIPRAHQQHLISIIGQEQQRGLAYRVGGRR